MRSLVAFLKKELTEQYRSGKLMILGVLFVIFGIMNPAVAKLTPLLLELMADSLAESGMMITAVEISAMDSWVQFFKNIPMALIAFVLLEGGILTSELQSGTLILTLTKGLSRYKVLLAKSVVLTALWSIGYWLCFCITYAYNAFYWDNSVAKSLGASVTFWWLFGVLVISLVFLFSSIFSSQGGVFLGVCGYLAVCLLLGIVPKIAKYLPTTITDGNSLIYGLKTAEDYIGALIASIASCIVCFTLGFMLWEKRKL